MKAQEWLEAWPYARIDHAKDVPIPLPDGFIVPDTGRPEYDALRREAYHLEDYILHTSTAGALHFGSAARTSSASVESLVA
jgi:hypothetical protein